MGFAEIRNLSLTLVLIVLSGIVFSMTSPVDTTNVKAVRGSVNATKPAQVPAMNNDTETNDIQQLVRTLGDAYENSLLHNTSNADMEAKDLLLESASIELSSRILSEIAKPSCEHESTGDSSECALDAESVSLKNLTDVLSYAAYRLENLIRSSPSASEEDSRHAATMARIESMEHLYRMTFAVSKIYLDRSQSGAYRQAAQQELQSARKHMEMERNLCACDPPGSTNRFIELSQIEAHLKELQTQ